MALFRGIGGAGDSTTDATITAVTQQATNAAASATSAASSASSASASATSAETSATEAATSATNASTSETNAATSATSAASSASAASTSETNAATSETNAAASESAAAASETNAAASETAAAASETAAAASASSASTSASNAATSASSAATSASVASAAQTAAEAAQAAAEAAQEAIDGSYLGAQTSDPTLDLNGDPVTAGDWYYNTNTDVTRIYDGAVWNNGAVSTTSFLLAGNNLSDVTNAATARTNLGLGTTDTPTFSGATVSANSSTDAVTITQTGTGNAFVVKDTFTTSFVVDESGNVGVGTSSPTYNVDISAVSDTSLRVRSTGTGSGDDTFIRQLIGGTTASNFIYFGDADSSSVGQIRYNHSSDALSFNVASSERMRINSSGNVGIGTSSPLARLHVSGSGSVTSYVNTTDTSGTAVARFRAMYAGGGGGTYSTVDLRAGDGYVYLITDSNVPMLFGTNNTERLRIDASGNVGIGTNSPSWQLHQYAASGTTSRVIENGTVRTLEYASTTGARASYGTASNHPLIFTTNATERIRIDSSGNVQIGNTSTSAASERFNVNGFAGFGDRAATNPFVLVGNTGSGAGVVGTYSNHALEFRTNNSERMRIDSGGRIGIGGSPGSGELVVYTGSITGAATTSVFRVDGTVASDVATEARMFSSFPLVAAGTYAALTHFDARQNTLTGTVTSQYGFKAEATLAGATNNYGFYSNLPAATGRWNFYAAGTAANYFAGNVGINRTTPSAPLDINGRVLVASATSVANDAYVRSAVGGSSLAAFASNTNTTADRTHWRLSVSDVEVGGIGTSASGTSMSFLVGGVKRSEILSDGTTFWSVSGSEQMRLTSTGLGIGTSSPSQKLSVAGDIELAQYLRQDSKIVVGRDSGASFVRLGSGEVGDYLRFFSGGAERMRIDSSGNLLVGKQSSSASVDGTLISQNAIVMSASSGNTYHSYNTANSSYSFYVSYNGTVNYTLLNQLSDAREKQNVVNIDRGLTEVLMLRPVKFDWKHGGRENNAGFLAQEVSEVIPEFVDEAMHDDEGNTRLRLSTMDFIPVLVKAIQEQQAIIDDLKARLDAANL